jgi:hypothetical protein
MYRLLEHTAHENGATRRTRPKRRMGRKQGTRETYTLLCHSFFSPPEYTRHFSVWLWQPPPCGVPSILCPKPNSHGGYFGCCFVLCDSLCGPLKIRHLRGVCVFLCATIYFDCSTGVRGGPSHSRVAARSRSFVRSPKKELRLTCSRRLFPNGRNYLSKRD